MISIGENNKKDCCGCTACACACPKSCIEMREDSEGFKYPSVNSEKCVGCGLCEKVCPVINRAVDSESRPIESFIVRNRDAEILENSSSGGSVTEFYGEIVRNGGAAFGAVFDENFDVVHACADSADDLAKFRGSKYVQSDLGGTFVRIKELLCSGRQVVFTGTPCQTAGLVSYLRKPYDNLLTVDFACHGVPSPLVWKKYRETMTKKYGSDMVYANFREKTYGYHSANLAVRYSNGRKSAENTNTDYLMKSFFDNICSRPSCYDCAFKTAEHCSDLTVFDCWNITRYAPSVKDDDKGYTAVFVQTEKGRKMLEAVAGKFLLYPADTETLLEHDGKFLLKCPPVNPRRSRYFELLASGEPLDKVVDELIPIKTSRKIFGKCKGVLYKTGMLALLKKLKEPLIK